MQKSSSIMDLVEGYSTYTDLTELNVDASSPAPAASTSPVCLATAASSKVCSFAVSGATVATVTTVC